jgi:hypothetical protein
MQLHIGPFSAAGGREWLGQAAGFIRNLRAGGAPLPFVVPDEVIREFEGYLAEWTVAAGEDVFEWTGVTDAQALHTLMTYWFNLAQYLVDHPELQPTPSSPSAVEFYRQLVDGIVAALAEDDPKAERFAERWPRP